MKRINDIFYSLQGEGHNTGMAAVFVRFAGCNLKCSFCDTDFHSYREMTDAEILAEVRQYPARWVILTGGEPTLQVDESLIHTLHSAGLQIAMETNGTRIPPEGIDWITCSPKGETKIRQCNELKVIFEDPSSDISDCGIAADHYYLQPCDVGNSERNAEIVTACVEYIKRHPKWRLSLQTHKLVGFK